MTSPILTTPQYATLRSTQGAATMQVSTFSNEVIFAGQITTDLSTLTVPYLQFDYGSVTVGAYTDVLPFQSLLISATNDITQSTFYGRIRLAPDATSVYCNESSSEFAVGAYFWVLNVFVPDYRLSRPSTNNPATFVELVDGSLTYEAPQPVVVGLQTMYASWVDTGTGKLRLAFDVSQSYAVEFGSSIIATLYSFPTGTVVGGSLSEPIVVMDFDPGELYGQCAVAATGGIVQTRTFGIKAHDPTSYPPSGSFKDGKISRDITQGDTFTIPALGNVDGLLVNTPAVVWHSDEMYGYASKSLWGGSSASVTLKACTTNVATLTAANTFEVGQTVIVAIGDAVFDGTWAVASRTASAFTYAFLTAQTPVSPTAASGLAVVNPTNVDFVGWLYQESDPLAGDPAYSAIETANFTFTGIGPRMARMVAQELAFTNFTSPTVWGQLTNLTPWRAICHFLQRYTTVLTLCDLTFDGGAILGTDDTFLFSATSSAGGNVFSAISGTVQGASGIANQIAACVEFAPAGQIAVNRDVSYFDSAFRSNLPTIANWTSSDASSAPRTSDPLPNVGSVDSDGLYWNPDLGTFGQAHTMRAPLEALGEAQGHDTLTGQILSATASDNFAVLELSKRTASKYNYLNTNDFLDVAHPGGYVAVGFKPSRSELYTWTLTAVGGPNDVNRVIYTSAAQWTIDTASIDYDAVQGFALSVRYRLVSPVAGPALDTTVITPPTNSVLPTIPDLGLPAFNFDFPELTIPDIGLTPATIAPAALQPPTGKVATFTGQELIVNSSTKAFWLRNVINLTTPNATNITPSTIGSYSLVQPLIDPFFTVSAVPAYLLGNDGATVSTTWYAPNAAAVGPAWTMGATVGGVYTVLRATRTANSIMIYSPSVTGTGTTYTDDLATALGAQTHTLPYAGLARWSSSNSGVYQATGGRTGGGCIIGQNTGVSDPPHPPNPKWDAIAAIDLGSSTVVTAASFWVFTNTTKNAVLIDFCDSGGSVVHEWVTTSPAASTWTQINWTGSYSGIRYLMLTLEWGGAGSFDMRVDDLSVTYGSGSSAAVSLSTDAGTSFGVAIPVGTVLSGQGGFDVQRAGSVSYAAASGAVYKATILGGTYSSHTTYGSSAPVCVIIPYYRRGSTTSSQTAVSDPDYIVALSTADTGTSTLYFVDGATATKHDITPVAGITFSHPDCLTIRYGTEILVWGTVSGVEKLYSSQNGGTSWTFVSNIASAGKIRCRRNDNRVPPAGQAFLVQGATSVVDYSSKWYTNALYPRNMPVSDIISLDSVW